MIGFHSVRHALRQGRATLSVFVAGIVALVPGAMTAHADTLDTILKRQKVICGVSQGLTGFSAQNADGVWSGFDVDFCKALSAALFSATDRVEYVPLSADERFDALKSGKIDVLSRNSTWTMSREIGMGFNFVGIAYYDGQSFMAPAARGWVSAMEIAGAKVCAQRGTTTEANAKAFFGQNSLTADVVTLGTFAELRDSYAAGTCDAVTADRSALAAMRMGFDQPDAHTLLPEVISKEPLGPVVRNDDPAWTSVVRWVLFALINAEEQQQSTSNPPPAGASDIPALSDKLPRDWYPNVIRLIGNYGEVFERNIGTETPLAIERGVNELWTRGGLLYAPPLR
jgi:general L-amino acid transport system substrate-binding protein